MVPLQATKGGMTSYLCIFLLQKCFSFVDAVEIVARISFQLTVNVTKHDIKTLTITKNRYLFARRDFKRRT